MKANRIAAAVVIAATLVSPVRAQQDQPNVCRVLEYAELKDMGRDGMTRLYCDYQRTFNSSEQSARLNMRDLGSTGDRGFRIGIDTMRRCSQEMGRIERILGKSAPDCSAVMEKP